MIAYISCSMSSIAIPASWKHMVIPMVLMKTVDGVTILKWLP